MERKAHTRLLHVIGLARAENILLRMRAKELKVQGPWRGINVEENTLAWVRMRAAANAVMAVGGSYRAACRLLGVHRKTLRLLLGETVEQVQHQR